MDMRSKIQTIYRDTCFATGNRAEADSAVIDGFADLAGYVPSAATLDRLLQGALLGRDHVIMRLLKAQQGRSLSHPATQALRLRPRS
jgi:hypothetical protein